MDIRDLVSVALTRGERVSLTLDPSPETDAARRWLVAIGSDCAAGETPEAALAEALRRLSRRRRKSWLSRAVGQVD